MSLTIEFIANHPFLTASAAALVGIIIAYEFNRATRGYRDLEAVDAPRLINHEDALPLDARSAVEFDKRHILNAQNVPEQELDDRIAKLTANAERPVIVYCSNGIASGRTAARLVRAGMKRVYNLKGGLAAWESAGLPVTRGRKEGRK